MGIKGEWTGTWKLLGCLGHKVLGQPNYPMNKEILQIIFVTLVSFQGIYLHYNVLGPLDSEKGKRSMWHSWASTCSQDFSRQGSQLLADPAMKVGKFCKASS